MVCPAANLHKSECGSQNHQRHKIKRSSTRMTTRVFHLPLRSFELRNLPRNVSVCGRRIRWQLRRFPSPWTRQRRVQRNLRSWLTWDCSRCSRCSTASWRGRRSSASSTRILPATIERSTLRAGQQCGPFYSCSGNGNPSEEASGMFRECRGDWRFTPVLHWAGFWFWPPRSRSVTLTSLAFGRSGGISWGSPRPTCDLQHPFSIA